MFKHMKKLPSNLIHIATMLLLFGLGYSSYPLLHPVASSINLGSIGAPLLAAAGLQAQDAGAQPDEEALPASNSPEGGTGKSAEETTILELSAEDARTLLLYKEAWDALEMNFYGDLPEAELRNYGAIRGLIESYNDPYTFFLEPKPHELEHDQLQGRFGGIGAQIEATDAGYALLPMFEQPAELAGIVGGDVLVQVDDTPISLEMPVDDVVTLIRGPVDTEVTLVVSHTISAEESEAEPALVEGAHETRTFTVTRAEIQTPSMDWRLLPAEELPEGAADAQIGYIEHRLFSDRSPQEMEAALEDLRAEGADRIILDLRGNPGGYVNSVVSIADMLLDAGVVMTEKRADGADRVFKSDKNPLAGDIPLVVIVDGASASASEILAGSLQDRGRALLVGEKTFGKGSVQIIYELPDESSMHITNAVWLTPDGHEINGKGLLPDVVIEPGSDPLPQAVDQVLLLEPGVPIDETLVLSK